MIIDDLLLDLAKRGRIRHITLGSAGSRFFASYRDDQTDGYCCHYDDDPVEALLHVLKLKGYNMYPGNENPEPLPGQKPKHSGDKPKRSAMELI